MVGKIVNASLWLKFGWVGLGNGVVRLIFKQ